MFILKAGVAETLPFQGCRTDDFEGLRGSGKVCFRTHRGLELPRVTCCGKNATDTLVLAVF